MKWPWQRERTDWRDLAQRVPDWDRVTHVWPDMRPGMVVWRDDSYGGPDRLTVRSVSPPDDDGWCWIDAVEGGERRQGTDLFDELTPEWAG